MPPIPISRFLVPEPVVVVPDGFARVDERLQRGLPHSIALSGDRRLLLIVPSGQAVLWRDADPLAIVTSSTPELAPYAPPNQFAIGDLSRPPAALLLQIGSQTVATAPLIAGVVQRLPRADGSAIRIELVVLEWVIRAGTLRGAGEFGSRISLAWRLADQGAERFSDPPFNPVYMKRLPPKQRLESELGRKDASKNRRFERGRSSIG